MEWAAVKPSNRADGEGVTSLSCNAEATDDFYSFGAQTIHVLSYRRGVLEYRFNIKTLSCG